MSAQRYRKRVKKPKIKKRFGLFFKFLIIIIIAVTSYFLFLNSKFWDGKNKLPIAIAKEGGDVIVAVFDPEVREISKILIPADTEVKLSRELGTLKIKNVKRLGENEGISGQLLAETVTRHFKFPVAAWADSEAEGFLTTNVLNLAKAAFKPYKTNLKSGDRVRLALFSFSVQNSKRVEIDLDKTSYLEKTKLRDGELGYVISGRIPNSLLVIFSDPEISKKGLSVAIIDSTTDPKIANEFGEVIEVLGGKISSVVREDPDYFNCRVGGGDPEIVEKVARLFSCENLGSEIEGNFDLQVELGEEFAKRF